MTFLPTITAQPADPLLGLIEQFACDPREDKIDLGVGVYRDAEGRTPVLAAVKEAERRLLASQTSKAYLGSEGDPLFLQLLGQRVFGNVLPAVQTPGGTGALRLAAELLALAGTRHVLLGMPTWPNHVPIFTAAGLRVTAFEQYDVGRRRFHPDRLLRACDAAGAGDAILIHGCCHNPTGADLDAAHWRALTDIINRRGLIPLVDFAYQGLGRAWETDSEGVRRLLREVPGAMIAYSCDKNFGLYRERVGALFIQDREDGTGNRLWSNAVALARRNWSMPPDHGAAVVRTILADPDLERRWRCELDGMRERIAAIRVSLADRGQVGGIDLASLRDERGMFAMLPLGQAAIERLRSDFAIYMAGSGRINIAGLSDRGLARFVTALAEVERVPA